MALLQAFDQTWGVLGKSFAGRTIYILSGIGNNNVGKMSSSLWRVVLGRWGLLQLPSLKRQGVSLVHVPSL